MAQHLTSDQHKEMPYVILRYSRLQRMPRWSTEEIIREFGSDDYQLLLSKKVLLPVADGRVRITTHTFHLKSAPVRFYRWIIDELDIQDINVAIRLSQRFKQADPNRWRKKRTKK